jgi:iron complex outermembrane receptor protein
LNYRVYLPIYQYSGENARMWGGEVQGAWTALNRLELNGSCSYVRGTFSENEQPMPWIPPLQGRMGIRLDLGTISLRLHTKLAAEQERLGSFEEGTDGFAIFGLSLRYLLTTGRLLHTFDLAIENLTDKAYRDHLSRVKSIMPEPGRNLRLLYRLYL